MPGWDRRTRCLTPFALLLLLLGCSVGRIEGGALLDAPAGADPLSGGCPAGQLRCGEACVNPAASNLHCGACNTPCVAGSVCNAGVCTVLCGAGQLLCDGVCTTVVSDLTNCGACGTTCPSGLFCSSGACSTTCSGIQCLVADGVECVDPQTNPSHCGGCGLACPPGASCVGGACALICPAGLGACGASCVDLSSDPGNCGFCGNSCGADPCIGGQCGCGPGQSLCAGLCVDVATNRLNCGGCGVACGDGAVCAAGACTCDVSETLCGAACVDLGSNLSHCGTCNQACAVGQVCSQGVCTTTCGAGTTNCEGSCIDPTTNRLHCGGCGNVCAGALACIGGQCVCSGSTTACGTECFDLAADSNHCGACDRVCTGGQTCSSGVCSCPPGQDFCDGVCVTTTSNPQHCGACGTACVDRQACAGGTCACPSGEALCGSVCVDVATSGENCGECGNACAGGQSCAGGVCRCSDGMTGCGELCIDTQTSNDHCGACDSPCPMGRSCVAGECSGIIGDGEDGCSGEAHSIEIPKLSILQGVEVPLMEEGEVVPAADRNASVVSQRAAQLRVYVALGSEWVNREVSARLHLTTASEEHTLYRRQIVTGRSVQENLDTTIQIPIDASYLGLDSRWWVEIVECEASLGTILTPRFPTSGDAALDARASGPVKVVYVPVDYVSGGTTWQPDISDKTLSQYAAYLGAMYPTTEIQTSVAASLSTPAPLDFSRLLDDVRNQRGTDSPPNDVYYMGIVQPGASMREYCGGSCTTGMGYVVSGGGGGASFRAAVSVAFGDEYTASTIAHELGHNHGRDHAPCGVSGDTAYPYSGGSIGSWGFDRRSNALMDPGDVTDIMGYCQPQWVSDYTFRAFFDRIAQLNGVVAASEVNAEPARRWRVALVTPAGLDWGHPISDPRPPTGVPESAEVLDAAGRPVATVSIYVVRTSEVGHETVLVPEPQATWHAIDLAGRGVLPFVAP